MAANNQTRIVLVCVLLLIVAAQAYVSAYASLDVKRRYQYPQYTQSEKGVIIDSDIILKNLPSPSFSDLSQARFTLVGTNVHPRFGTSEWNLLAVWVKNAHNAGLRTFVNTWYEPKATEDLIKRAASIGVDVVALDELLARYSINQAQLESIIQAGLRVNSKLLFVVNEYEEKDLTDAYAWTSKYANVRTASDNYNRQDVIDFNIQLALQYGKRPLVWLIFAQGSQDFNCYTNLSSWIAYVKARAVDGLFWYYDVEGTGQAQWSQVVDF